jgi:predicted nucleic acid-binding protein
MDIVFFDASVLFKSAVTRFLLGAGLEGEFRPAWSHAVVDEARRGLVRANRPMALRALEQNLVYVRDPVVARARQGQIARLSLTDEKDRHVLAPAASAEATMLVTGNVRHFDRVEATSFGVRIVDPDELATQLARRNPFTLVRQSNAPRRSGWIATSSSCRRNCP